jgi:hypothetical protein
VAGWAPDPVEHGGGEKKNPRLCRESNSGRPVTVLTELHRLIYTVRNGAKFCHNTRTTSYATRMPLRRFIICVTKSLWSACLDGHVSVSRRKLLQPPGAIFTQQTLCLLPSFQRNVYAVNSTALTAQMSVAGGEFLDCLDVHQLINLFHGQNKIHVPQIHVLILGMHWPQVFEMFQLAEQLVNYRNWSKTAG